MKSIIEQASSITKAIEKAWDQAGKPKEFSIKIFETEERNFFGMTTKPAKIGIFFDDKPIVHEKSTSSKPRQEIKECRPELRENKQKTPTQHQPKIQSTTPFKPTQPQTAATAPKVKNNSPEATSRMSKVAPITATWNDKMIGTVDHWLKRTLSLMGIESVSFNSEIIGKILKITFNKQLTADAFHEKQLFRSFAHLIMSSLRNQYKQEIKDLKVILARSE